MIHNPATRCQQSKQSSAGRYSNWKCCWNLKDHILAKACHDKNLTSHLSKYISPQTQLVNRQLYITDIVMCPWSPPIPEIIKFIPAKGYLNLLTGLTGCTTIDSLWWKLTFDIEQSWQEMQLLKLSEHTDWKFVHSFNAGQHHNHTMHDNRKPLHS